MTKSVERLRGFAVLIQPYPGITLYEVRKLERRIEDYAQAHDLQLEGHQLSYAVSSRDRSLTSSDQVDLADWLSSQPGISALRLTPLSEEPDRLAGDDGFLLMPVCDTVTIGLKLLYRARRISAELYLQILGGFVRSVSVH